MLRPCLQGLFYFLKQFFCGGIVQKLDEMVRFPFNEGSLSIEMPADALEVLPWENA